MKFLQSLINRVVSLVKPAPPRHKFVLLTGQLAKAQILIDGEKPKRGQFDADAADLDLGPGFGNKQAQSITLGDTTYILWKDSRNIPQVLKKGVRYQKDLGDMDGKILNLKQDGFTTVTPRPQPRAAEIADAEKAVRHAMVQKELDAGDARYGRNGAGFRESVVVSEISLADAVRLAAAPVVPPPSRERAPQQIGQPRVRELTVSPAVFRMLGFQS